MGTENTMNALNIYVEPGDILFNRNNRRQIWRVVSSMGGLRFIPIDGLIKGDTSYLIGPGDWIHCKETPELHWTARPMQAKGDRLVIVPAECVLDHIKEEQGICKPEVEKIEVEKIEVDKIEPTGEITWVRSPTSSALAAPSVINDTKTYTETTTMNNTKTTTIPVYTPEELRGKKISIEDFCVPVDALSENKLAAEKMLNSGVPCHEIVSTLRRIVNNCEAFLRLKKMYPVKCGEMNVYIDEIYRDARKTLHDLGYEAYSTVPEDLKYDVMYMPTEDGTPNGKTVEPEPCALANSREKEQDPLVERFPMLGFDASDCAKILIKRENDTVKVPWLYRLNDILCQIKNRAESGCRGLCYDDLPVSYFAWTHDQMCTNEEKEVKYIMRELEQRGFKVKVLSVPSRGKESEDSNICLGIDW